LDRNVFERSLGWISLCKQWERKEGDILTPTLSVSFIEGDATLSWHCHRIHITFYVEGMKEIWLYREANLSLNEK
jgi:hypothetical protein